MPVEKPMLPYSVQIPNTLCSWMITLTAKSYFHLVKWKMFNYCQLIHLLVAMENLHVLLLLTTALETLALVTPSTLRSNGSVLEMTNKITKTAQCRTQLFSFLIKQLCFTFILIWNLIYFDASTRLSCFFEYFFGVPHWATYIFFIFIICM